MNVVKDLCVEEEISVVLDVEHRCLFLHGCEILGLLETKMLRWEKYRFIASKWYRPVIANILAWCRNLEKQLLYFFRFCMYILKSARSK